MGLLDVIIIITSNKGSLIPQMIIINVFIIIHFIYRVLFCGTQRRFKIIVKKQYNKNT